MKNGFALLILLGYACSALADDFAVSVGDYWTFSRTQARPTNATKGVDKWTRRVLEIGKDGEVRTQEPAGDFNFDRYFNPISKLGSEFQRIDNQPPYFVGKQWSYKRRVSPNVLHLYEYAEFKVVSFESVTVPAGTFDCFHIQGERKQDSKYHALEESIDKWVCPAVHGTAKIIVRRQGRTYGGGPGIYDTEVSELVDSSYAPATQLK